MEQRFSGQIMQRDVDPAARQATLGEIGINQFAPYLMNRIMERWNGNLAEALKLHDMSTTMMRALAVLSISSPVTINELSAYAVTEQSTMSRTLDFLEAQGLMRRQRRAEDMRIRDVSSPRRARGVRAGVADDARRGSRSCSTASRRRNTARSPRRCSR